MKEKNTLGLSVKLTKKTLNAWYSGDTAYVDLLNRGPRTIACSKRGVADMPRYSRSISKAGSGGYSKDEVSAVLCRPAPKGVQEVGGMSTSLSLKEIYP